MKLTVGTIFQSKLSLIHCLSSASYNPGTDSIEIDVTSLTPNLSPKASSRVPVWHGSTKKGFVDVQNDNHDRASSIWEVTEVETDPTGCGSTSMINYGKTSVWARHYYKAKRINLDGSQHESGETVSFSSSGTIIKDLQCVRLS